MTGVLITGARAPVALELARTFAAEGHRVVVADSVRSSTASSRSVSAAYRVSPARYDPVAFRDAVQGIAVRHRLEVVVPTCEEVFWLAGTHDPGRLAPRLLASSLPVLRSLHDKAAFARLCREAGVAHPATEVIGSTEAWRRQRRARAADPRLGVIAKPAFSRFASAAIRVGPGEPLPDPPRITRDRPWVVQELLEGEELCVSGVAASGVLTAAVVYRAGWRAGRSAAVALERVPDDEPSAAEALAVASRLVAAVGLTGLVGFDLLATADGVVALECNPRATSGLHLFAAQDGLAARILSAATPAEAVEHADADAVAAPPIRAGRDRVRLAVPHVLMGVPGVLAGGRVADWARRLRDPDVLRVPGDRLPAASLVAAFAAQLRQSARMRRPLLAATTHDIEWNGEPMPGERLPSPWQQVATRALTRLDPTVLAPNLPTVVETVRVGALDLPATVTAHDDPRADRSYIVSPIAHYVDYSREELRRLPSALLRTGLVPVVEGLGVLLDRARADDVIMLGNHLVSTSLHADWTRADLASAVDELIARHPGSAVAVRNVHPQLGRLPDLLRDSGWVLVPARSVLLAPTADDEWLRRRDVRRDRALAQASGYRLVSIEQGAELSTTVAERLVELYSLLYLEKHSRLNPRYTVEFIRLAVRTGLLEVSVLERAGRIDGVVGVYGANGWLAAPLLGYDTTLPRSTGLYRMLSLAVSDAAHERGLDLHASSGVAGFKRSRGAEPELEWTAVQVRHLSAPRRGAWRSLAILLDTVAVPLLSRYSL